MAWEVLFETPRLQVCEGIYWSEFYAIAGYFALPMAGHGYISNFDVIPLRERDVKRLRKYAVVE